VTRSASPIVKASYVTGAVTKLSVTGAAI